MSNSNQAQGGQSTLEACFRREHGKLVALFARTYGMQRLELIEDAVQEAMVAALGSWSRSGIPKRPAAWLQAVAKNRLIDELRRAHHKGEVAEDSEPEAEWVNDDPALGSELESGQLRMLFVCADQRLPNQTQLIVALKLLCGFSVDEIARRLFLSKESVFKRLSRGRSTLRTLGRDWDARSFEDMLERTPAVRQMIYLMFNEGYSSAKAHELIRKELCMEAIYLASVLVCHSQGAESETLALLSLMNFHAARLDARTDQSGGLLLLEDQDRSRWDRGLIAEGFRYFFQATNSDVFSRYHAEAAIAAEHCRAPSFEETNWAEVIELYELIERISPSPLHTLNRAIAVAQLSGPEAGLSILRPLTPPGWLARFYLWDSVLGELERRAGNNEQALTHLRRALEAAPTDAERALIQRRINDCTPT